MQILNGCMKSKALRLLIKTVFRKFNYLVFIKSKRNTFINSVEVFSKPLFYPSLD